MIQLNKEKFLGVVIGSWIALSYLGQIPSPEYNVIRKRDYLNFIPNWKFFAPVPASYDLYLYARYQKEDGTISQWYPLHEYSKRDVKSILWYPFHRSEKMLFDITSELQKSMPFEYEDSLRSIPPYHALVHFAYKKFISNKDFQSARKFQFCLLKNDGFNDIKKPEILLVSDTYDLDFDNEF